MERAGVAESVAQGVLVVRCFGPDPPSIGETVVDERLDRVGTIVDVFGPVDRPYLAVNPAEGVTATALLGDRLYVR